MAIVNVTPDSFYDKSRNFDPDVLIKHIGRMVSDGADILDIGGYSSRPGAKDVPEDEEMRRVELGVKVAREMFPDALISVDTFRSAVARRAVEEFGADIVNDVTGGTLDSEMYATVAELHCPYVLTHMRGTPQTRTKFATYPQGVTAEVLSELSRRVADLELMGVSDIVIDPGFGFAKTMEQNYELMRNLSAFEAFHRPILVGVSRKSMINDLLEITPDKALNATTVLNTLAIHSGASILRVHDPKEARQLITLLNAVDHD